MRSRVCKAARDRDGAAWTGYAAANPGGRSMDVTTTADPHAEEEPQKKGRDGGV